MHRCTSPGDESGLTLVEVLIATLLLVVLAAGTSTLSIHAIEAMALSRLQTSAVALATARMEQLRSLDWGYGEASNVLPSSDFATDLSTDPSNGAGTGLRPSPSAALDVNTPGFVDFLDRHGRWLGTGVTAPAGATFVRRWSIEPDSASADTLILQVRVMTVRSSLLVSTSNSPRLRDEARLVTMKMRKAR